MVEQRVARMRAGENLRMSLGGAVLGGCAAVLAGSAWSGAPWFVFPSLCAALGFGITIAMLTVADGLHSLRSLRRIPYLIRLALPAHLLLLGTMTVCGTVIWLLIRDAGAAVRLILVSAAVTYALAMLVLVYAVLRELLGRRFLRDLARGLYGGARQEHAVVAFVDIIGSTAIADGLAPDVFFDVLNEYFAAVDVYATFYHGTIYKYLGDGAVLLWTAGKDAATHALAAMLGLRAALGRRRDQFLAEYGCVLDCAAGIHSGPVLVGGIGREKREVGYWGDTLNTASRIQGLCKDAAQTILVSDDFLRTLREDRGSIPSGIMRPIGEHQLRGKHAPLLLWAVRSSPLSHTSSNA